MTGQFDTLEYEVADLIAGYSVRKRRRGSGDFYRDGLVNLLEDEGTRQAVRVLEERTMLANVMAQATLPEVSGVQVVIGGESRWEELKDCTIILARYGLSDEFQRDGGCYWSHAYGIRP